MPSPCLDAETLKRYLLGKLEAAEDGRVGEHLSACPACVASVQRIQFDLFLAPKPPATEPVGRSLADRLQDELRLPWRETVRLGKEISLELAAAHEKGRIHRNLRPSNVSLGAPGAAGPVTLVNFAATPQPGDLPEPSAYLAPELAHSPGDARADLFSLGAILYQAVTGTTPFKDNTLANSAPPPPPRTLNANMPAALSDVILRLLARNAADRPASARDVVGLLEAIAEPPRRKRGRVASWVAVGLVLAAGIVVAGLLFRAVHEASLNNARAPQGDEPFGDPAGIAVKHMDDGSRYLLIRAEGERVEEFHRLAEALASQRDGDVIEVHGDGPIALGAVNLDRRGLRLRAAVGFRPRFVCVGEPEVWLTIKGPIDVQGCDFVGRAADYLFAGGDGPWEFRSCRIIGGGGLSAINHSGPKLQCRDCLFINTADSPLVRLGPSANFEAIDCIVASDTMIETAPAGGHAIRLEQSTIQTGSLVVLPRGEPAPGPVVMTVAGNVLSGGGQGIRLAGWTAGWEQALRWTGEKNLYVGRPILAGPDGKVARVARDEPDQGPLGREPGSRTAAGFPFAWQSHWEQPTGESVATVQRQVNARRDRHGLPELGLPGDLLGGSAGQADKRIPFVLRRGDRAIGSFDQLRPALLCASDGDTIELHGDSFVFRNFDPPANLPPDAPRRRLTLSAGAGFRPVVEIESFPSSDSWSLIGLTFRGAQTRLAWPGMKIDRLDRCEFRGGVSATAGMPSEMVRCFVAGPLEVHMERGDAFVIRQSLIGGLAIESAGGGGRIVEFDRCVVRPARTEAAITASDFTGLTIVANDTWFDCPGPLIAESRDLRGWNGTRNLFGIGPRFWSGDEALGNLSEWRQRWVGDFASVAGEPLIHDPLEWRLTTGAGFGADVAKVAPK